MNIQTMYCQANRITSFGIQGYQVKPKYQDVYKQPQSTIKPKKHQTKRGSYLDDQAAVHKNIPGPGVYQYQDKWKSRPQSAKVRISQKKTFIQQIIDKQKKQKKPAPGQYKIFKSIKQLDAQKKKMSVQKRSYQDRKTYLDNVQFEASMTPGVGQYNARTRSVTETSYKRTTKPQEWRKKHQELNKKKRPKTPAVGSYDPKPGDYHLFGSKVIKKPIKSVWGNQQRFKEDKSGSGLGPGRYYKIQEWNNQYPISRVNSKSVYYQ